MDLVLERSEYRADGIFGKLLGTEQNFSLVTLEHSYEQEGGDFTAKLPRGTYVCRRGIHQLAKATNSFETFEITEVPGHTNILFHPGNYNADSEGCVLLGTKITQIGFGVQMVEHSKAAFELFMQAQDGLDSFLLLVTD